MKTRMVLAVLICAGMMFIGCGSGGSSNPGDVVKDFYTYMTSGDLEKAFKLLPEKNQKNFQEGPAGLKPIAKMFKVRDGIKAIEITKEDISGDTATVRFKIVSNSGKSSKEMKQKLVKENGKWKIAL